MAEDNKEVLEAISALSSHVDTQIKEEIGKVKTELMDHVTRTVANATLTTRDPRVSKVVLKLRDKNVFSVQDVQDILASPVAM